MNFDAAFDVLLKHEGGYSDHAADPGGKTRYGVTEAVAREVGYRGDMRELPVDLAKKIYKDRYWDAVKADQLPPALRYALFDAAVNSGPGQAVKWLQRALGVKDDGAIGPQTIAAANAGNPDALRMRMLSQRLKFMAGLSNWPSFSRGWALRIASLME
jgi:lysozyme family protein